MARSSGRMPRLFLEAAFAENAMVELAAAQAQYLVGVLRLGAGDSVLVFNGRDGEWRAEIAATGKKSASLRLGAQTWPQIAGPDIQYLFAPLKRARLDYMVQKATELASPGLDPS